MKSAILSAAPLLAAVAQAAPLVARQNIDATVLQFALTLEHLENYFYTDALNKFSQQDFEKAGYSEDFYNDLKYVAHDEEQHVILLQGALKAAGVTPVAACAYSFPYTDVKSFISLASVIEGLGTDAYLGAAPLITSKPYLSVAGSILVTEAIHTSLERLATGEVPAANPYGTSLEPNSVYTVAANFITSCPASNPALPFKAYPGLAVNGPAKLAEEPVEGDPSQYVKREGKWDGHNWHGGSGYGGWNSKQDPQPCPAPLGGKDDVSLTAAGPIPKGSFVTFVSGLSVVSVPANANGNSTTVPIPASQEGQTYVFITSKDVEGALDTTAILFGPAILEVHPQPPVYGIAPPA